MFTQAVLLLSSSAFALVLLPFACAVGWPLPQEQTLLAFAADFGWCRVGSDRELPVWKQLLCLKQGTRSALIKGCSRFAKAELP